VPHRAKTEPEDSGDFMSLWSGQAAALGRELQAGELTKGLAEEALSQFFCKRNYLDDKIE